MLTRTHTQSRSYKESEWSGQQTRTRGNISQDLLKAIYTTYNTEIQVVDGPAEQTKSHAGGKHTSQGYGSVQLSEICEVRLRRSSPTYVWRGLCQVFIAVSIDLFLLNS